ncbi:ABC transporter permease [Dongia sp.]|uniref:ABC transporter permease n=1 Tax=Dongia sp. TaxID=1977262 RepID=UPI0035B05E86
MSPAITTFPRETASGARWIKWSSLLVLAAIWHLTSLTLNDPALVPSPWTTLISFHHHLFEGNLLPNLAATLARVAVAFALAMVLGSALGILMGRSLLVDNLFGGWLVIALNMPALVTMVLCYVWFGLNESAAILAVTINKAPLVAAITREGARAIDSSLLEMTRVFGVSPLRVLQRVVLPQIAPSFMAAARAGLALTWKIVLVVELLGRPSGIGFEIRTFFNYFDIASILAYSLAFVAVVMAIEGLVLQPLEHRAQRWRRT